MQNFTITDFGTKGGDTYLINVVMSLFIQGFSSQSRTFYPYVGITITGKGL